MAQAQYCQVFRRQRGRGTLVVVNSLLGSVTVPEMGAYATAKWGQRAIARTLQQEVASERGIHVCVVSPGSINTPIYYQAANYVGTAGTAADASVTTRARCRCYRRTVRAARQARLGSGRPGEIRSLISGFRLVPFVYDRIVGPLFRLAAMSRGKQPPTDGNVARPVPSQERVFGRWPER